MQDKQQLPYGWRDKIGFLLSGERPLALYLDSVNDLGMKRKMTVVVLVLQ